MCGGCLSSMLGVVQRLQRVVAVLVVVVCQQQQQCHQRVVSWLRGSSLPTVASFGASAGHMTAGELFQLRCFLD